MTDVAKLNIEVDSSGLVRAERNMGKAQRASQRLEARFNELKRIAGLASLAMAGLAANSVRLAVDAEETANKFAVVFRGSIERTDKALRELTKTIPLTQTQLRGFAAAAQDMLVPLGLVRSEAADMSVELVKIAGDIASFNNVDVAQVLGNIQSALAGEAQVLRKYGISVSEARLKTVALEEGLISLDEEMTTAARAQAVLATIVRDSSDAIGDAARTVDSSANAMRFLSRDAADAQEIIGQALIPAFQMLLGAVNDADESGISPFKAAILETGKIIIALTQGVLLLAAGFKRVGQFAGASAAMISESFRIADVEASDLIKPGAALGKFFDLFKDGEENLEDFNRSREAIMEGFKEDADTIDPLFELVQSLGEAFDRLGQRQGVMSERSDNAAESIATVGETAKESEKELEKLAQTGEDFMQSVMDLEAQLAGPLAVAWRNYNQDMELAIQLHREGAISQEQLGQAAVIFARRLDEEGRKALQTMLDIQEQMLKIARFDFGAGSGGSGSNNLASSLSMALSANSGANLGDSIGNALRAHGSAGIQDGLQDALEDGMKKIGIQADSGGLQIASLAIGEAVGGNIAGAIGTAIGGALGGPIGATIGNLVGTLIGRERPPRFDIAGSGSLGPEFMAQSPEGFSTDLGEVFLNAVRMDADVANQIRSGVQEFVQVMAGVLGNEFEDFGREGLERLAFVSLEEGESMESVLQQIFDNVLDNFDSFTRELVEEGHGLEDQFQRLADIINIRSRVDLDGSFGFENADQVLATVNQLTGASETLGQAFERITGAFESLQVAADLTGNALGDSAAAAFEFSDALVEAFGGNLDRLRGSLSTIFETFFSDEELFEQQAEASKARATELFRSLGVDISDALFTEGGFRELFDNLFGNLSADDTALLIEAGVAVSDLIDAEAELAEIRGVGSDSAEEAVRAERERAQALRDMMEGVDRDILRFVSPTRAAFMDLRDEMAALYTQAIDLGASEEQLRRVRELQARSIAKFTNDLKISILELADDLFGTEETFTDVGNAIVQSTENVRDAVIRNLERIDEWLDRSLLGNFSPLTPTERLGEAQSQFESAFNAAMSGDFAALENLPALADALLSEGAGFFGTSTEQYRELFDMVRGMMEQASEITPPEAIGPPTFGQVEEIKTETSAFRQRLDELEQMQAAWNLGDQIGTLSEITGDTPAELARALGFTDRNMRDLLGMLGHDIPVGTGEELADYFNSVVGSIAEQDPLLNAVEEQTALTARRLMGIASTGRGTVSALGRIEALLGGETRSTTTDGRFTAPTSSGASVASGQTAILERMDARLRNLERISGSGFATVADEERRTRQTMSQRRETARA